MQRRGKKLSRPAGDEQGHDTDDREHRQSADSSGSPDGVRDEVPVPVELEKLIGLGERSLRKSYYPELRRKISELERFQVLVDNARDFIILVRLEPLCVVHANLAVRENFTPGITMEDAPMEDLLGQVMASEVVRLIRNSSGSDFITFQAVMPRHGSVALPVEATASRHQLDGVEYVLIVARDISERLQAEQALSSSAQRISAMAAELGFLLSNMGDFLFRRDSAGTLTYISPSVEHVLGYTPEELLQQGTPPRTDYPNNVHIENIVQRILSGDQEAVFHTEVWHRKGHKVLLEVSERAFYEEGVVAGTVAVARDITERVRAAEETRRLKSLLANILNGMPSVLVGVDCEGRILQWNRRAEEETGIPENKALGSEFAATLPRLAYLLPDVMAAVGKGAVQELPRRTSHVHGRVVFEQITIFPLIQNGDSRTGAVIRVDDVTEQVRLEQIMVQTEKMMSVGGLAAGMAHEINNPLGGILQGAQNILRRFSPELPANIRAAETAGCSLECISAYIEDRKILRMIEGIRDSAIRAADIVRNMLSFARKSESSHSTCQFNDVIENTIRLASTDYDLKKSFDFRHITITREYASELPPLTCSRTEIEQVLLNLLRNAAQAMVHTKAPEIVLRTRRQTARDKNGKLSEYVVLEMQDNGPGMNEQTRLRIFEPFFTTKEPGVGTGLGLSVSYFIITENHRGQMEVESLPGAGTTFIIRLPLTEAASVGGPL